MNPTIEFYLAIFAYLQKEDGIDQVSKVLELAQKTSLSWEVTDESLRLLWRCIHRVSEIKSESGHLFGPTLNDFVTCAFKDLSIFDDSFAREVFFKIAKTVSPEFSDGRNVCIWAKSIKKCSDGSGVVVLHVSHLERFRKEIQIHDLLTRATKLYTLEEGLILEERGFRD